MGTNEFKEMGEIMTELIDIEENEIRLRMTITAIGEVRDGETGELISSAPYEFYVEGTESELLALLENGEEVT